MTKVATAGFVGSAGGQAVNVTRGDRFPDDHEVVKNTPENFADTTDKVVMGEIKQQDARAAIDVRARTEMEDEKEGLTKEGLTTGDVPAPAGDKK